MTCVTLQQSDMVVFMRLPEEVRQEVECWVAELAAVSRPIQASLAAIAERQGVSLVSARRRYDAWRRRGWRGLVNRNKSREHAGLPREFIEYWRGLCQANGRKCRPAYREFVRQWRAGEPIPGMPPDASRRFLPRGYTYANLLRFAPTKFELIACRIGRSAAAVYRPKVFTTRAGLAVGEFIVFDDVWHDFEVVMLGQRGPRRLLQLHALDLFSGCQFARGMKPRVKDEEGKATNLNEEEMLFLVASVLEEYGYRAEGCTLMVEHGTAALSEDVERALHDLTGGKLLVDRSGIEGASAFAGQYLGRSKGNFRFKAALESLHNLLHNETANMRQLPGQTGSLSRTNAPEELHGRERHAELLLRVMESLPVAIRQQLALPFVEVTRAIGMVNEICERINCRTEHDLEGWVEAGLTTVEFDVPGVGRLPQHAVLSLPADRRAAVESVATPVPRRLSPREVFDLGKPRLTRFRPEQTAKLLYGRTAREVSVGNDHIIAFEDVLISPSPLRFLAHHWAPGTKFEAVLNPWSPERLHLFDARGRWIGQVNAWQTISRNDPEALHRQMGAAAKVERELLHAVSARGTDLTAQRLDATRNNIAALRAPERAEAARLRKLAGVEGDVADLVDVDPEPSPAAESDTDFAAEGLL